MKKSVALLLTVVFALSPLMTAFAQENVSMGLVTINLQALFFNQINDGAQQAANEFGVDLQIVDGNNDPALGKSKPSSHLSPNKLTPLSWWRLMWKALCQRCSLLLMRVFRSLPLTPK